MKYTQFLSVTSNRPRNQTKANHIKPNRKSTWTHHTHPNQTKCCTTCQCPNQTTPSHKVEIEPGLMRRRLTTLTPPLQQARWSAVKPWDKQGETRWSKVKQARWNKQEEESKVKQGETMWSKQGEESKVKQARWNMQGETRWSKQGELLWSPETKSSLFVLSVIKLKHDQTQKGRNNQVAFYVQWCWI